MGAAERLVGVVCETWYVAHHVSHVTHHTSHVRRHISHTNNARVSSTSAPISVTSSTGVRPPPLSDNPLLQPHHQNKNDALNYNWIWVLKIGAVPVGAHRVYALCSTRAHVTCHRLHVTWLLLYAQCTRLIPRT